MRPVDVLTADKQLVGELLAGDLRAFDRFFDEYFPRLFRFCLRRLDGDEDAAEEVAQAAISRAIVKLRTFRGEAALFTWLCTFCRYEMSARFRKARREPARVELAEDNTEVRGALESLWAGLESVHHDAVRSREIADLVHVALDHLPGRYGDALEWKYIEGLSVQQVGERLGTGTKAAESMLSRARAAFREAFEALSAPQASTEDG